ncbi:LicD family protein [Winogradskyella jejuensis]|uniref:Lipopolysaccharide cholinephosphotransferase n=1 Tax=Winogradskyella jejuensis TaxID=1089305 RepID=A0A1M5MTL1_9FLAO|nr:LicD family protein [Winogradskyella jejuensis]SHG80537.1 lipopolysaccharide cholinephosphotransferase [Winogradskyella jejuensis]
MTENELKSIHSKLIVIAEYFDNFCKENDIEYYLMGGTALGAIRHKGFIPWDDDYDTFMDYANYTRFKQVVKEKLDTNQYYFQEEDTEEFPLFFSKLRMNNTTYIEKDSVGRDMHHGLFLDIMCLNNTYKNKSLRYLQYIAARAVNAKALAKKGYLTQSRSKIVALRLAKVLISSSVKKILLRFIRRLNNKDTEYIGHFFGRAPFKRTSFKRSLIGEGKYVKFETLSLPVFYSVEEYLRVRYGDKFMEMPSQEVKDLYPSHAYIVDLNNNYSKYMQK